MKPIYQHNCDKCIYLGTFEGYDFYYCRQHGRHHEEMLLRRYGDNLPSDWACCYVNQWDKLDTMTVDNVHLGYRRALAVASERRLVCKCVADIALSAGME